MNEQNAKIESTELGGYNGGARPLAFWLHLDYGSSGQGAGGYGIGSNKRLGELISRILEVAGVNKWEDLPGKHIRVRRNDIRVFAIGNIIKDDWLDFNEFFKESRDEDRA